MSRYHIAHLLMMSAGTGVCKHCIRPVTGPEDGKLFVVAPPRGGKGIEKLLCNTCWENPYPCQFCGKKIPYGSQSWGGMCPECQQMLNESFEKRPKTSAT